MQNKIFKLVETFIPDIYTDYRGDLWTVWEEKKFKHQLMFNHDKFSTSRQNVLRGIHADYESWKLISCVYGEVYLVVVDNRPDSPDYLKWDWTILNDNCRKCVLLPPGFGNAHLVLSESCVFYYKWAYIGDYPDVDKQFTLKWDDPRIGVEWPINDPILQKRDR